MKKKESLIGTLAVISVLLVSVQAQHSRAGTSIFPYLRIDFDARSAAMAGASVAVPGGINGYFYNPAITASIKNNQWFLGYRTIMDGVWGGPVAFSRVMDRYGVFTLSLTGVTSGDIEVIGEENGNPVYTDEIARDNFLTGGLTWAKALNSNFSVGATVKGIYDVLKVPGRVYSASGAGLDAGVFYRILQDRFTAAVVIRNAGFLASSYDENSYSLPLTFEAGISYVPRYISSMRLALDINKERGDYLNYEPGLELNLYKKKLFLMLGFAFSEMDLELAFKSLAGNEDDDYIKSNWNTLCLGMGINTDIEKVNIRIDLALQFKTSPLPPSMLVSAVIDY
ncbi:MAG: PorV/PorQ family protein [Fibrobacter sp.]|jgi:hypothetical protein|nr:PorV/PorQ family protein [Fibrobacter sp.]